MATPDEIEREAERLCELHSAAHPDDDGLGKMWPYATDGEKGQWRVVAADVLGQRTAQKSNNQLKRTLEFDVTDAPMLMAAARLAACTAMMCGHKSADKKLRTYQQALNAFIPPEAARFEEETWAEIGMAIAEATTVHITITPKRWERDRGWWYDGPLQVTVTGAGGEKRFYSDASMGTYVKRGEEEAPRKLAAALTELAPMECVVTWDAAPRD